MRKREIGMVSQSDLAFLLIIFFLVVGVFGAVKGINIVLPSKEAKPVLLPPSRIFEIEIRENGKGYVKGVYIAPSQIPENTYGRILLLKVCGKAKYGNVVNYISWAKKRGFDKVSIVLKK